LFKLDLARRPDGLIDAVLVGDVEPQPLIDRQPGQRFRPTSSICPLLTL
jgi:hypothetical protein